MTKANSRRSVPRKVAIIGKITYNGTSTRDPNRWDTLMPIRAVMQGIANASKIRTATPEARRTCGEEEQMSNLGHLVFRTTMTAGQSTGTLSKQATSSFTCPIRCAGQFNPPLATLLSAHRENTSSTPAYKNCVGPRLRICHVRWLGHRCTGATNVVIGLGKGNPGMLSTTYFSEVIN